MRMRGGAIGLLFALFAAAGCGAKGEPKSRAPVAAHKAAPAATRVSSPGSSSGSSSGGSPSGASAGPKAGDKCEVSRTPESTCIGSHSALACGPEGLYREVRCKGPAGCTVDKKTNASICDDSVADEGDACILAVWKNWSCSVDGKRALLCEDGRFKANLVCRGGSGCKVQYEPSKREDALTCDTTLQQAGDPCREAAQIACSVDRKAMLKCQDGKFEVQRHCRGARGCSGERDLQCDMSIADLNDPCAVQGMVACGVDGKSTVVCKGGKYVKHHECRSACTVNATNSLECR